MSVRCSIILKPQRWTRTIHRVVLADAQHEAFAEQVSTDVPLTQPYRHQRILRDECCEHDRRTVALNDEIVGVAVLQVAINDKSQCAFPVVVSQSCAELGCGIQALTAVTAIASPANPHTHLDQFTMRCARNDELFGSGAGNLATVFNYFVSAI